MIIEFFFVIMLCWKMKHQRFDFEICKALCFLLLIMLSGSYYGSNCLLDPRITLYRIYVDLGL